MTRPSVLKTRHGTEIAYHQTPGAGPGVVFLGGFMSDMEGSKALALEAWCRASGRAFVRFDYQGHGQSSGTFAEGTIGVWAEDALAVVDALTEGPQILVGSSMGGWISLLVARARPGRVHALVGVAAAPDFTVRMWRDELTAEQRGEIEAKGKTHLASDYGDEPYTITRDLIVDGWSNRVIHAPFHLNVPVRLIQGTEDADVPWSTALTIAERLTGDDVEVILVPGGDHRLSREIDLRRLTRVVGELAGR
jgi:pimeloyl-ACP methyl ester carboxylesterase